MLSDEEHLLLAQGGQEEQVIVEGFFADSFTEKLSHQYGQALFWPLDATGYIPNVHKGCFKSDFEQIRMPVLVNLLHGVHSPYRTP